MRSMQARSRGRTYCFVVGYAVLLLIVINMEKDIILSFSNSMMVLHFDKYVITQVERKTKLPQSPTVTTTSSSSSNSNHLLPALSGFPQSSTQNFTSILSIGCCSPLDPVVKGRLGINRTGQEICYTQRACTDPTYPFASKEELEWFRPSYAADMMMNETEKQTEQYKARFRAENRKRRRRCEGFLQQSPPIFANPKEEPQWCSGSLTEQHFTERVPSGCNFDPFGFYVFPKAKLVMCLIPKAGLTEWFKFLRFSLGAADYQSQPYNKGDVRAMRLYDLPVEKQLEILKNPSWTKAVFLRHPAERLLSAFLDKIQQAYSDKEVYWNVSENLDDFVDALDTRILHLQPGRCAHIGPSWCWDPHWRPQAFHCGMHEYLPSFDFVGRLDQAANHTKALLQMVGLWESHGKHFVVDKERPSFNVWDDLEPTLPPNLTDTDSIIQGGFQQDLRSKQDWHTTGASSKMDKHLGGSSKKELLNTIHKLYSDDFALWNALVGHHDNAWMTGRQLAEKVNPSCVEKTS